MKTEQTVYFDTDEGGAYIGEDGGKFTLKELIELQALKICHTGQKRGILQTVTAEAWRVYKGKITIHLIGTKVLKIETPAGDFLDAAFALPIAIHTEGDTPQTRAIKTGTWMRDFQKEFGPHSTISSAAFQELITMEKIKAPQTNKYYDKDFRSFYFAGRCEAPSLGKLEGPFNLVDINSAFPAAMTENHAWGVGHTMTRIIPHKTKFKQSFFKIRCKSNRAFPFRAEKTAPIEYPCDKSPREYFVTGWELAAAQDLKLITDLEIIYIYIPNKTRNFKKFVTAYYDKKKTAEKAGDPVRRQFAKLILNSAYGKLAQDPSKFTEVTITELGDVPDESEKSDWKLALNDEEERLSYWHRPDPGWRYFDVATAASITGAVRAQMLHAIHQCRGVCYMDTDSIVARDTSALSVSDAIGEWKVEMVVKNLWVAGKKLYAAEGVEGSWKTASRGVCLTAKEIIAVTDGREIEWRQPTKSTSWTGEKKEIKRTVRLRPVKEGRAPNKWGAIK